MVCRGKPKYRSETRLATKRYSSTLNNTLWISPLSHLSFLHSSSGFISLDWKWPTSPIPRSMKVNFRVTYRIRVLWHLVNHACTAYQDVRSDKSDTNWLLIDYEVNLLNNNSNSLILIEHDDMHLPWAVWPFRQAADDSNWQRRSDGATRAPRRFQGFLRVCSSPVCEWQGVYQGEIHSRYLDWPRVQSHAQSQGMVICIYHAMSMQCNQSTLL